MRVYLQHLDVNGGAETALDLEMSPIHELPPTRGGLREMASIHMAFPIGGPAHKALSAYEKLHEPVRLRTSDHVGMWLIQRTQMPTGGDMQVRLRLVFAGSVDRDITAR